jgi:dihydropteroate synthase
MQLQCGLKTLDLTTPIVMGVLNVTPDSFSDGGQFLQPHAAIDHAMAMIGQGAAIIDVGGESTRPGAAAVGEQQELDRVIPVIEAIAARSDVTISIDTSKPAVMATAIESGAGLVNDVRALREAGAIEALARSNAAVCLMHMQGEPATMQRNPQYENVIAEVRAFLEHRIAACRAAGIDASRIALDPGIGFGKTVAHNLTLLAHLPQLAIDGHPIVIGVSRKSTIGMLTGNLNNERVSGGLALTAAAILGGALIIRTHDVAQTIDAVRVAHQVRRAGFITGEGS